MMSNKKHSPIIIRAIATLLFLLPCVSSAVARDTTRVFSKLQWDEDDRLNLVAGDGYLSYYAYGHDGNRAIKMTGNAAIDQSGTLLNSTNLENITIYPSEYLTVTQAEYTKYYYAGGNRIASKIGTGGFEKMQRLCTLDQSPTYNANTLLNFVLYQITNPTNQAQDAVPVETCNGYNINTELLTEPLLTLYITQTNLNFSQSNLLQQFRQNLAGGTEAVYYFHSDHLGSASWITDGTSAAVQHLLYLPFGEHFVNEQSSGYFERFTFTGKERDAETGYYYFGARFDNVDLGFMSVDPMADKYPSLSPYAYCAWNPVILHDPNGEFPVWIVWAIVGAGLDYGSQVYENYQNGKSGYDAWCGDVNFASVGLSAINPTGKFKVVGTVVVEGLKAAIEYKPNEGVNVNTNVEEVAKVAAVNTVVNSGTYKASKSTPNKVNVSKSTKKQTHRTTSQMQKDVATGHAPKSIVRFDKGSGFREKDHVHFSDGTALNKDGTWKHIKNKTHKFTNEEKKYLKENGWKIPE